MQTRKSNRAPGHAGRKPVAREDEIELEIERITKLPVAAVRDLWRRRLRGDPPQIRSADVLRRILIWRLQVQAFGGLDAETAAAIRRLSRLQAEGKAVDFAPKPQLRPGAVLVREWRGLEHRVLVLDQGFEHCGKRYQSLSEVARTIAGTRWSGPRFFGLEGSTAKPGTKA
ncbi:MAG: DUF2924 domain-containing protein [Alphaproteobacteria bacterium]|nr:DUF2924 domain-containing protein [Alphaproteobacteria bacterium]